MNTSSRAMHTLLNNEVLHILSCSGTEKIIEPQTHTSFSIDCNSCSLLSKKKHQIKITRHGSSISTTTTCGGGGGDGGCFDVKGSPNRSMPFPWQG